jgi:hypothetical protein
VGVSPTSALVAASTRPATILGLDAAPGLIELDHELHVLAVSRAGRTVYRQDA